MPANSVCAKNAVSTLAAVEEIRRMRGGSQAHLMRCSDGHFYVVKFANNPQGRKILANELLGAGLAKALGLPVAHGQIIDVDERLIHASPEMVIDLAVGSTPCTHGLCFGSQLPADPRQNTIWDLLPDDLLPNVINIEDFYGMLVLDQWTCNCDRRQVVFHHDSSEGYRATMIDQGFCFDGSNWNFPDSPLRGVYCRTVVYDKVTGMEAFEPSLGRLESEIDSNVLAAIGEDIPPEWYGSQDELLWLLERLDRRRSRVRDMLCATRQLARQPFPNWISRIAIGAKSRELPDTPD